MSDLQIVGGVVITADGDALVYEGARILAVDEGILKVLARRKSVQPKSRIEEQPDAARAD